MNPLFLSVRSPWQALCLLLCLTVWPILLEAQTETEAIWPDYSLSISLKNASLFELLQQIEAEYPLRFYFKEEWLSRDKRDWNLSALPVEAALKQILQEDGLDAFPLTDVMVILGRPLELKRFAEARRLPVAAEASDALVLFQAKTRKNVIGDSTLRPLPVEATISGAIFDPDSDEGLMGVTVAFPDLQMGDLTDSTGAYSVTIPTGAHKVLLRSSGRETREEILYIYSDGEWETDLAYTAFQLDEVLLEATGEEANVNSVETGLVRLSPMEIRKMPNLLGEIDIVNSVMMVPGVSSVGEAARGFNVRGGNIDQNLVMQEGSIILNSSHLLGFYSLFHPDLVKEVNLYKGHIPAQFGGRISSVLDVKLDEGSYRKVRGRATVGAVSSKVSVGGPIIKNQTSFLLGIRTAYPKLLMNTQQLRPNISDSDAFYGDITAKVSQKLGDYGTLSANTYLSTDRFKFAGGFGFNWQNAMGGLEWKQIYNQKLSSTVKVNASQYRSNLTQEPLGAESEISSGMDQLRFKAGVLFTPTRHTIHAGVDGVNYQVTPNRIVPLIESSAVEPRTVFNDQGLELGIYANDEIKLSNFLGLSVGVRLSQFANLGPGTVYQYGESSVPIAANLSDSVRVAAGEVVQRFTGFEPRVSLRANIDEKTSVKLGYNRMYQYVHLLSNSAAATPVDLWQLSNTYFPAQSAHNYFFGVYRNFRSNTIQASMEFYYR
ncbi:MAG: TonB-dependent receptor, partial [Bacteroidota bacterium]